MSNFLSQQNIFNVAQTIYQNVNSNYKINIEGLYLEDIQKVMIKLWEKNKDKKIKSSQEKAYIKALNKKTVELVLPQVYSNIQAGYLNKTNNEMFYNDDYQHATENYSNPQNTNQGRQDVNKRFDDITQQRQNEMRRPEQPNFKDKSQNFEDPNDAFERLRKERELNSQHSPVINEQNNLYSQNNYQQTPLSYDNHIPITKQQREEIQPHYETERFEDGKPIIDNQRQNMVSDVGPVNEPDKFFSNPQYHQENSGPSLDSFFKANENLRGEKTNLESINDDVEKRFAEMAKNYGQDGQINKPKNTSNKVEDVIGKRVNDVSKFTKHLNEKKETEPELKKELDEMANDKTTIETFRVKEEENEIVTQNRMKEQFELIINNQQSNNAYLNHSLIPPQKMNYITRKYYITVDSLQRDLEAYPLPTNFQVRFEQPSEEIEVPSYLNENGVVVYGKPIVYENVGGRGAKLENIYNNLVEIRCLDAQIPLDQGYVGGFSPYDFNGPKIDENKQTKDTFSSYPYGPIWENNYGIKIDVLDEPFYYLVIDELDGAYDGTNLASRRANAKLNFDKLYGLTREFVNLKTSALEGKTFYPTNWAKLSQMTLQLVTRFNRLLNLGVDKVYIESIEQGDEVEGDRYCPIPAGSHLTKIKIITDDPSYGMKLCGHDNSPGDRLLFYSIFQCDPKVQNTKLNENIYINFDKFPVIYFYMVYDDKNNKIEKKLDVNPFLNVGDMIVINNKYILDIEQIDMNGINVKVNNRNDFNPKITVLSKGFVKKRKQGNNCQDNNSLLAEPGQRVGGNLTKPNEFQLLFPFEQIPDYLKSPPYGFYKPYEAFYIHARKQITYTFEVTQVEQNMENLDSRIVSRT